MPWNLLEQIEEQDHSIRHDAAECLRCAAMQMKKYYERKHIPKHFCVGDKVLLRLGRGYDIPVNQVLSRKLGRQYAGRSTVLERVGRLAYRLDLPSAWKPVHPVISVQHLEPAPPAEADPFG